MVAHTGPVRDFARHALFDFEIVDPTASQVKSHIRPTGPVQGTLGMPSQIPYPPTIRDKAAVSTLKICLKLRPSTTDEYACLQGNPAQNLTFTGAETGYNGIFYMFLNNYETFISIKTVQQTIIVTYHV